MRPAIGLPAIGLAAIGLALGGPIGCRRAPEVPADFVAELTRFRETVEAEIAGPDGPLATIDAHYVEPGHILSLSIEAGRPVIAIDGDDDAPLVVRVDPDAIVCTRGCGDDPVSVDTARHVELAPLSLDLSPQSGGLRVLVHDPNAPARAAFSGLSWAPPDPKWWRPATLEPTPDAPPEPLATTRGLVKPMRPAGRLEVSLPDGGSAALVAYEGAPGELLVPFRDPTNAETTYDVGRYLTVSTGTSGPLVVDFNRATNPWCAYSAHYNCPIPPAGNRVSVAVDAGERRYH